MFAIRKIFILVFLIIWVFFECAPEKDVIPEEVVKGELGAKLDNYLTRIIPFGFSGALLVAKEGEVVLNKGYGMAIRSKGIHNTARTVFSTGSITKQFTAAAIMKLEMQEKLNTHDPLSKYLEGVPEDKKDITLHHLLTHTSGVIGSSGHDFIQAPRDETVKRILNAPLQFHPGEQFSYSNCGYSLLAAIIEKVSGKAYEEFLNENLFKPARMNFTGYRMPSWEKRVVAHWYSGETDNLTPLSKPYPQWNLLGNGGILSTTEDMYKWHLALSDDSILSAEAKKKLYTPFLNDYAYGWDVMETEHGRLIKHDGGSTLGIGAEFRRYIEAKVVFVLFSNKDGVKVLFEQGLREKVNALIFGGDVEIPPAVQAIDPAWLRKFEGNYELPSGARLNVSPENSGLKLTPSGQDAISLLVFPDRKDLSGINGLNSLSAKVFQAIIDGNYQSLPELFEDEKKRDRFVRLIKMRMNRYLNWTGNIQKVETLGTIPGPDDIDHAEATVVTLHGEKERIAFKLLWRHKKVIGVEPMMPTKIGVMTFRPLSETDFAGYHLGFSKNVRISFSIDTNGSVNGIVFHGKKRDFFVPKMKK